MQGYVEIQKCPVASISGHVPQVLAWGEAAPSRSEDIGMFFQGSEQRMDDGERRGSSSGGEREVNGIGVEISAVGRDDGSRESDSGEPQEEDLLLMSNNEGTKAGAPLDAPDRLEQMDLLTDQPLLSNDTLVLEGEHTCTHPLQALQPEILTEDATPSTENGLMACAQYEAMRQDDDVIPVGDDDAAAIHKYSPFGFHDDHLANNEIGGAVDVLGSTDEGEPRHSRVTREGEGEERRSLDEKEESEEAYPQVMFMIISRRSRHRAGTRYKRRGADISGAVANYVETEFVS